MRFCVTFIFPVRTTSWTSGTTSANGSKLSHTAKSSLEFETAVWVPIEGYKWPYRINEDGTVQKKDRDLWVTLAPRISTNRVTVSMRKRNGTRIYIPVVWLMADAFMGGRKPGMCIYHKNGLKTDNSLHNLEFLSKGENGKRTSGNRRRAVEKIAPDGTVVELYKSACEAAKKNYVHRNCVSDRCNGVVKNPFRLLGYSFRWEERHKRPGRKKNEIL